MATTKQVLERFFAAYADRVNDALKDPSKIDVDATTAAFAKYVIGASPEGVHGGKNGRFFRLMIPRGLKFYKKIGTKSMTVTSLDMTQMDEFHWSVRVHWNASYIKKDGTKLDLPFDVIYFLQVMNDVPKIFAYITGDEQKAYRENGLIT